MVYKLFYKKAACGPVKCETMQHKELAEELYKPNIRNCQKQKIHSYFIDNI